MSGCLSDLFLIYSMLVVFALKNFKVTFQMLNVMTCNSTLPYGVLIT